MIYINAETPNSVSAACVELAHLGFHIVAMRPAPSWDGREPETLIIARVAKLTEVHVQGLVKFANSHKQDCVAIRLDRGIGLTVGSKPVEYREEYFNLR